MSEQDEAVRATLSAVVDQSVSGVAIFGAAGTVEYVNERFERLEGLPRQAVLGRQAGEVLMAGLSPVQVQEVWAALRAGRAWTGELERPGPDGGSRWQAVCYFPVRDAAGALSHFVRRTEDATDRHRLEGERHNAQKLESLATLAGGIAHDFNNILTGIVGLVEAARTQLGPFHPVCEELDELSGLVDRATRLTRGLLAFGHRAAGLPVTLELGEVVDGEGGPVRRLLGERHRLTARPAAERLPVLADRGQLEQVITNLITNARDAMPGGGEITVALSAAAVDAAQAARHGVPAGRYAVLSVSDRGGGMDAGTLARIFDPFFTTKPVGRGTGLGLPILRGLVRQNHGFVEVQSAPGQGSRFDVHLPLCAEAAEPPGDEPGDTALEPAALRGHGEAILLAEDDPTIRGVWSSLLRRNGYLVTTAEDGLQAVEAVRAAPRPFDAALLDVTMPRLRGPEALLAIRELDPRLPVIFSSGYPADRLDLGAAARRERLLQKPLAPSMLLWELQRLLQRAAAAR